MSKVSIIIPIWNINEDLEQLTKNALDSFKQTLSTEEDEFELIIIDNDSPITTNDFVYGSNIYLRNKSNLGFPKAVNQGFKIASGEFIAVVNNDVKVSENWWIVAKEAFERVPKAGLVHFRMLEYNQPNTPADQIYPDGKERWCHGSFYVIKKEVIDKVGMYDENFILGGGEDWDYFKRIRKAGFKQVYTNGAFFQHKDSSTQLLRDQNERKESDEKNREYYKSKWGEYPDIEFEKQFSNQFTKPWRPYP